MHRGSFQRTAHEGQIEELSELLACLWDGADNGETIAFVQTYRGHVAGLDESDHGTVPSCPGGFDQGSQKPGTKTMTLSGRGQVDRVLDGTGIALIGVPCTGDREADDLLRPTVHVGNESRSALHHGRQPGLSLDRILLNARPDRQRLPHGRIAETPDTGGVLHGRWTDPIEPCRRHEPPFSTYRARYRPVRVLRSATICAGVPVNTTRPPSWPAPGPMSMTQSACAMTA